MSTNGHGGKPFVSGVFKPNSGTEDPTSRGLVPGKPRDRQSAALDRRLRSVTCKPCEGETAAGNLPNRTTYKTLGHPFIQTILADILRWFGAETGTIHLMDGGILVLKAHIGVPPHVVQIVDKVPVGKGIWTPPIAIRAQSLARRSPT